MQQEPHRLVFLDETYVNTKMTRLRGRSRKGQRLRTSAPFGHWKTHTFIAGLRCSELSAPWMIVGPIARSAFAPISRRSWRPPWAKATWCSS
ncbi:IS630 family transposase, partial [Microvirga sp. KLBC 81]